MMKNFLYGLIALVALAPSISSLVLAETENEGTSENLGKQATTSSIQTESEGNDDKSSSSANSNYILFVTIGAISSVVGYTSWKVYKIRRRASSKNLV